MTERDMDQERNFPPLLRSAWLDIVSAALRRLPTAATAQERQQAVQQARKALQDVGPGAKAPQLIEAANMAVACVADDVRRRQRREKWRQRAPELLPWGSREKYESEAIDLTLEALGDLPLELSDLETEKAVRRAIKPLCDEIEAPGKIEGLIKYGCSLLSTVLWDFYRQGTIDRDQWLDSSLRRGLEQVLAEEFREGHDYELNGSETQQEVGEIVREIVLDELEEMELDGEYDDED